MPDTRRTPQRQRAVDLLADGNWREYDYIRREIGKVIPPGMALRRVEVMRLNSLRARRKKGEGLDNDGERLVQRSQDYLIDAGRRRLALEALKTRSFEFKVEDGKRWVRLRADLAAELGQGPLVPTDTGRVEIDAELDAVVTAD